MNGERAETLFLVGGFFRTRREAGLTYRSQSTGELDRALDRRRKLQAQLEGIRLAQERRPRTLLRHLPTPLRLHVPLHFEARQQLDIARGAVDVGFLVALLFCAGSKLCPFRLNGVARLRLVVRAPFLRLVRVACGLAYSRDIEFRRGVRDRDGVQGS